MASEVRWQEPYLNYPLAICKQLGIRATPDQLRDLPEPDLFFWALELLDSMRVRLNFDIAQLPAHWESHFAKVRLLQATPDQARANELFCEYVSLFVRNDEDSLKRRSDIEEALDQLTTKRHRAELGNTLFDRLAEGGQPTPAALERDPKAGLILLQQQTVEGVLRTLLTTLGIKGKSRLFSDFCRKNSNLEGAIDRIRNTLNATQWNQQFFPALEFRLALGRQAGCYFDSIVLEANANRSAHEFLESILVQGEDELEAYLAEQNNTEALWKARAKILFPSLKLAQNGARIDWGKRGMTQEKLRLELANLNNVLGEMGVTVRQCGPHLRGQLSNQRSLTKKVVCEELYKNDPAYAAKVMADFDKYTLSLDSFLISVDMGPLESVGEILIAKVQDNPPTYTVEFLYVDDKHRKDYGLGTLVQNIAQSLVSHIPHARLVATVYSANENMTRHFKRGWVGTGIINQGKTIELQLYEGELYPTKRVRIEDHSDFIAVCEQYLVPGESHLLMGVEPVSGSKTSLFPCLATFGKASPSPTRLFYNPHSP